MKILIADDDADLRALIGFTLANAGFDVCTAIDGSEALQAFDREAPDFLLLDVNMPEPNGLAVCREVRRRSAVPIMMLTVRDQEDDLVAALECGADDYVNKPFSPRALLARVRALARRSESTATGEIQCGISRLDLEQQSLRVGNSTEIRLTPLEVKAIHLLMLSSGRTVTVERLLAHIWGRTTSRERRTLKQLIYRLRRKVERDPTVPELLQTTPGAGYKFNADYREPQAELRTHTASQSS
ncbi:MAG TPA: response regulator transcription factor [Steroidobacteraceae bacterium]|nr:response regulator transcription factor [Steroidobacteraceae bacterium]